MEKKYQFQLNSNLMEDKIVIIQCGSERGTAFFVSQTLLLTAYHVVSDDEEDKVRVVSKGAAEIGCTVKQIWEEYDLALIEIPPTPNQGYLDLLSHRTRIGECAQCYGYPDHSSTEGLAVSGTFSQRLEEGCSDLRLNIENCDANYNYEGMSGAPVLQNGKAIGVIIEQAGTNVNLVSISSVANELQKFGVVVESDKNLEAIPDSIKVELDKVRPNYPMYYRIEEALDEHDGYWIVLYGTPGSGKTTIAAGFIPKDSKYEVIGRFFFKIPDDKISRAERCSIGHFVDWVESVFLSVTGSDFPHLSSEDKRKAVGDWLYEIDAKLVRDNTIGVIVIDGLDEISKDIDDYLSLLSVANLNNLRIVLTCISTELLPVFIVESLNDGHKIEVKPLSMASCELYIKENSGNWDKPYSFIQAVANKSEGHPLYMNYLCRYIDNKFSSETTEDDLNGWVESLPNIDGDIETYYNAVWKSLDKNSVTIEVLTLLSQLRGCVKEEQLVEMLLPSSRYSFVASVENLHHLLKNQKTDNFEIYHSSFRIYVSRKQKAFLKSANDQIAAYCSSNVDTTYSIENLLHHTVCGSSYMAGLAMCNQKWADICASKDVSPDLILQDIKECLSFAVDNEQVIEIVRLMLLAQRIENRYDSVLYENTDSLARIDLLEGKPDAALKYLVRENALLIDIIDAVFYLQSLFELKYEQQALKLADAIEAKIRKELHESSEGVSTKTLVAKGLYFIILYGADYASWEQLHSYFDNLKDLADSSTDEASRNGAISVLKMVSSAYVSLDVRKGKDVNIGRFFSMMGMDITKDAVILGYTILQWYLDFEKGCVSRGKNNTYLKIVRQLETFLENNSFHFSRKDTIEIINLLVSEAQNSSVITSLIKSLHEVILPLNFRDKNGVDINTEGLFEFYRVNMYSGYMDDKDNYMPLKSSSCLKNTSWENYCEAIVRELAYLNGRIFRKKADNCMSAVEYNRLRDLLNTMDFSFKQRTQWNRSYLLPEEIFPFIYDKTVELYRDFYPDKIEDFILHVKNRSTNQMSLYLEGFSAMLIRTSGILASSDMKNIAIWLSDKAYEYILYAVQNRGQRCGYLMSLALNYSKAGAKESCEKVYSQILKSSMGPEWYKEAQLDLLTKFKELNIHLTPSQSAHIAGLYEAASGEMTFQRYVQQEKNSFVGMLVRCSSLADSIAYYKYETLPDTETVIKNSENWIVDMPEIGEGYDLGANHLIEASALHYMLEESVASPIVKYALSELFWDNDDKMHNDHGYANLHASIISRLSPSVVEMEIIPRMAQYYTEEYNREGEKRYLADLESTSVSDSFLDNLESALKAKGFDWKRYPRKKECKETTDEKQESSENLRALLKNKRKDVISPISCYWYSLSTILHPLVNFTTGQTNKIFEVVTDHFDVNVSPEHSDIEKFEWMRGYSENEDQDVMLIDFLIWFLVHPDYRIVRRAENSLKWLAKYESKVINRIVNAIINSSEIGVDICASRILRDLAYDYPDVVSASLAVDKTISDLCSKQSFSISRNLLKIGQIFNEKVSDGTLLTSVAAIFPDTLPARGEVWFEPEQTMFVGHIIDKLNNLNVTGGDDFAIPYSSAVNKMLSVNTITNLCKDCKYIRRSFYLTRVFNSRYDRTMIGLMDKILYGKVGLDKADRVYHALNSY